MTKSDLVDLLANIITGLDNALMTSTLLGDPPTWQLVYALRNHLDDQQRDLLRSVLDQENATYTDLTAQIQAAGNSLRQTLTDMTEIDAVIRTVSLIAADVDQVLKLVP